MQPMHRHRILNAVSRRGVPAVVIASLVTAGMSLASGPGSASWAQAPGASQLAGEYLKALGPVNMAIAKVETSLKSLPATASSADVEADVAPLQSKIAALQALLTQTRYPTTPGGRLSLAALGPPVVVEFAGTAGPSTANFPAPWGTWHVHVTNPCFVGKVTSAMTMAGAHYSGLQLRGPSCAASTELYEATWHFGTAQSFAAEIGLDSSGPRPSVTMGFVATGGPLDHPTVWMPLPSSADGTPITTGAVTVASGVPTPLTVDVAGIHELTMLLLVDGPSPIIDIANGVFQA